MGQLSDTYELQARAFGHALPLEGEALADFVTWNVAALVAEVGEALEQVGWKNWAARRGWVNREAFVGELIDVQHFLNNLLCSVGVTDEELQARYAVKQELNRSRQRDGYQGDRHRADA